MYCSRGAQQDPSISTPHSCSPADAARHALARHTAEHMDVMGRVVGMVGGGRSAA